MSALSESKILFWLSLPYISVGKQAALIKRFGSARELWDGFERHAAEIADMVSEKSMSQLRRFRSLDFIDGCLDKLRKDGISVITMLNPLYPKLFLQPEVGAPAVLYFRGEATLMNTKCVAVVGTRACTPYGRENARKIARTLAENGVTVVSGLATGIDAYAHEGALEAKGNTIAVLGSGLNKVTPVENIKLYERIIDSGGLVISEYKPNEDAMRYTFPARNRLISGLSVGTVVVEAGAKSGALITANLALEQNREVFALPGNVDSTRSVGCNELLHEGANFVRNGEDILEFLSVRPKKSEEKAEIVLDKEQKKIYDVLYEGQMTLDELVEKTGIGPSELASLLPAMELDGLIVRRAANLFALKGPIERHK